MNCPRCRSVPINAPTGPYRIAEANPFGAAARETHGVALAPQADVGTSVEVHQCPQCGGAYLVHGALEAVENSARKTTRKDTSVDQFRRAFARPRVYGEQEEERVPLDCPQCDGPMLEREWGFSSLVFVDVCLECRGTWLDVGELETLRRFFSGRS